MLIHIWFDMKRVFLYIQKEKKKTEIVCSAISCNLTTKHVVHHCSDYSLRVNKSTLLHHAPASPILLSSLWFEGRRVLPASSAAYCLADTRPRHQETAESECKSKTHFAAVVNKNSGETFMSNAILFCSKIFWEMSEVAGIWKKKKKMYVSIPF